MTFEQSELQKLVEEITELIQRYIDDPSALKTISSEFKAMYQRIPIYTGIIANLLPKVVQPIALEQLKEGDEITILLRDDQSFTGKVMGISPRWVKLVDCKQIIRPKPVGKQVVPTNKIKEIRLLTRGILEKEKPT